MPIYEYECSYCQNRFEEFHKVNEKSGKSWCNKCGSTAFKLPSVVHSKVFRPREFADGTKTPPEVDTFEKEKEWKKKENIHYDPASKGQKETAKKERKKKILRNIIIAVIITVFAILFTIVLKTFFPG